MIQPESQDIIGRPRKNEKTEKRPVSAVVACAVPEGVTARVDRRFIAEI